MCGRYILIQKAEFLEKRFKVTVPDKVDLKPSYNIAPGKYAPVITNENPHEIQLYRFGLTPFWASKSNLIINARAEGDSNPDNDPRFNGSKGIISKPAFRRAIRMQRCLIPADAFIEGPEKEKLDKPYVVYLQNKVRPFAFAGIWDNWTNPESGEIISSFAIITTVANSLLQKIPHHRSPVILHRDDEKRWLYNDLPLAEVTDLLVPYPGELMNAYPIAPTIKNPRADDPGLIHPAGERLTPEYDVHYNKNIRIEGMGSNKYYGFDELNPLGE
jgi:putative SOS response-associated peptidase YedK